MKFLSAPEYRLVQITREGEVDFTDQYKSQLVKASDDYRQAITHFCGQRDAETFLEEQGRVCPGFNVLSYVQ